MLGPDGKPGFPVEDRLTLRWYLRALCDGTPEMRSMHAKLMADVRRYCFAAIADSPDEAASRHAAQLRAEGVTDLGTLLDPARCAEMLAHFQNRPVYAGHVPKASDGIARSLAETRAFSHYGAHARADVLACPHALEIANDPRLLQIVEAYLGCPPTIYSIHAWWSFPQSGTPAAFSQALHRDLDELKFVTLFVYLTPVDARNGPHRYVRYSHDKPTLTRALMAQGSTAEHAQTAAAALFAGNGYEHSDLSEQLCGQFVMRWTGPAGSAILADTYGLHMGLPLIEGERLMFWVRYGLGVVPDIELDDSAADTAAMARPRIPGTERARYVNRLLLGD